ncbi:Atu4866 domain-containing protein [Rhizobium sp. 18065]|uniref:Atu4866 domain-containing protein n=1 Tax=Rhizobium sp. 18065 TaxID=2681411 RepID=UPI00135CDA79|nr:Atu4866 domain-containing protein [Rhizobium sp. 18065]
MADLPHATPGLVVLIAALAFLAFFVLVPVRADRHQFIDLQENDMANHPYVGLWVTGDGHIRHELLPSGRYIEGRGSRERAYVGRYEVRGSQINYWDDSGFIADGEFRSDILYHGGMVLYRH